MKAWLYSSTSGGLETNLQLATSTGGPPKLRTDDVLVEVVSASLNPADFKVPEMGTVARMVIGTPATPGMDFCGRVAATGPGVTDLSAGQLVYGCLSRPMQFGSLGEYLVISAGAILPVPDGVQADHAAALGIAGQTAYQSLDGYVTPNSDQKVFINGGSGGCGIFAIQIAKQFGCHVTTTCSTRNMEFVRSLGADEVIDYTSTDDLVSLLRRRGVVFDHIIDHIGVPAALYRESHHFLREGGAFIQVGAGAMTIFAERLLRPGFLGGGKRKYVALMFRNERDHLRILGEWVAQGKVKVQLDGVYEFEDAVKAFEKLRSGRARGKIVVHVGAP